jgi:hypothetical protein
MIVNQSGLSLVTFAPESEEESEWLTENVQAEGWQYMGKTLAVDTRYAGDLIEGVQAAGFEVTS